MSTVIVIQVRSDISRALRGEDHGQAARDAAASIKAILEDGRATLVPVHPDAADQDLGGFFHATIPTSNQSEVIAHALRGIDGVEAAYVKPVPAMP